MIKSGKTPDSSNGELSIRRLSAEDAPRIVACFEQVYGDSYANAQFYDPSELARLIEVGALCSVGAVSADGELYGHMAMTRHANARSVEMGNTVVSPAARGQGVAWKVGAELQRWAVELGYRGFLHYPTTDHHIMQRQSVTNGYETGLMLGYIPAETDGQVADAAGKQNRNAATIVYQPIGAGMIAEEDGVSSAAAYLPRYQGELLREMCGDIGITRQWMAPGSHSSQYTVAETSLYHKRGLQRLTVRRTGADIRGVIDQLDGQPCLQVDFQMDDPGIEDGLSAARHAGFYFCGWLPGFSRSDVFRMQKCDLQVTNLQPELTNPVARELMRVIRSELP